jgi:pimeloyl-ACP methyl ester carboxylesterase
MEIERGFVRIAEGQMHYRRSVGDTDGRTLVMIHMSPVASGFLVPLMEEIGDARPLFAPDTLGNGDSAPAGEDDPDISYFAGALNRALDAIGIETIDLYGVRTGAMIATEFAIAYPGRVNRLFIDELPLAGSGTRTGTSGEPCPPPDSQGSQLDWAFHVMKDHWMFYPWWSRDAAHRMPWDLRTADVLHDQTVEVLKAIRTFQSSYGAALRWPCDERISLIRVPTTVFYQPERAMYADMKPTARAISGADIAELPPGDLSPAAKAAVLRDWLARV